MNESDVSREGRSLARNVVQLRARCLGPLAAALAMVVPAQAQSWTSYDPGLGTLPEAQGWTFVENDGPPSPVVEDGVLKQGPTGSGCSSNYEYWHRDDAPIDFDATVTLEVNLRVISSNLGDGSVCDGFGCSGGTPSRKPGYIIFMVDAGERHFALGFTSTGVLVETGCCFCPEEATLLPFDTTDGFHLYRVVIESGVGSLYIDNQLFHTRPVGITDYVPNTVLFGDATHLGSSQTELDYIRYTTDPVPDVPAVSDWGLVTLTLLVLTAGTLVHARRRPAQA